MFFPVYFSLVLSIQQPPKKKKTPKEGASGAKTGPGVAIPVLPVIALSPVKNIFQSQEVGHYSMNRCNGRAALRISFP